MRRRTVEWQVAGACNYACSYCIQSPRHRVGSPSRQAVEGLLAFLAALPGTWEVKMSGGEPFAFPPFLERVVPALVEGTPHAVSVLTNLSASLASLERFALLTRGRLGIVSASLHLEFTAVAAFVEKALRLREWIGAGPSLVVNSVLVPGRLAELLQARDAVEAAGLPFFPQVMKVKGGVHDYDARDRTLLPRFLGLSDDPRRENRAPSYLGRRCWAGVDYLVLTQSGDAFSCRTARRFGEGFLGNALNGGVRLADGPRPCPYEICPCTVPANRGMVEGIGAAASAEVPPVRT
jgi:MoaA/NifB/PqqE/SkfB family radical SAM enzyme